ncbi:MAG: ABC transporter permease subunit, partial [Bacteroidetes bacterium]
MARYLLKRLLWFVPTLLVVALVAFGLSRLAPGDPVELYLRDKPFGAVSSPQEFFRAERDVRQVAQLLGQDKPAFYFSILPDFFPDTLNRILQKEHRAALRALLLQHRHWPSVENWHQSLRALELSALQPLPDVGRTHLNTFKNRLRALYTLTDTPTLQRNLDSLQALLNRDSLLAAHLQPALTQTHTAFQRMRTRPAAGWFLPSLHWHGTDNQFHRWLADFFRGDFGLSYFDRRPVGDKLQPALLKTLTINVLAILLAYLLAVPLGVWAASHRGSPFDRGTTALLLALYSLPSFWAGTMLLVFFTTPEYGMDWFEGVGWSD